MFSLYSWDFTSYLPQHCLYFFPLPHASQIGIFSIFIVLWIFPLFSRVCGQVTFCIFCTIFAVFYIKYSPNVHKMCTNLAYPIFSLPFILYKILIKLSNRLYLSTNYPLNPSSNGAGSSINSFISHIRNILSYCFLYYFY